MVLKWLVIHILNNNQSMYARKIFYVSFPLTLPLVLLGLFQRKIILRDTERYLLAPMNPSQILVYFIHPKEVPPPPPPPVGQPNQITHIIRGILRHRHVIGSKLNYYWTRELFFWQSDGGIQGAYELFCNFGLNPIFPEIRRTFWRNATRFNWQIYQLYA